MSSALKGSSRTHSAAAGARFVGLPTDPQRARVEGATKAAGIAPAAQDSRIRRLCEGTLDAPPLMHRIDGERLFAGALARLSLGGRNGRRQGIDC